MQTIEKVTALARSNREFDLVGLGSALLDLTCQVDESFLDSIGLQKGHMHLIDEQQSRAIQKKIEHLSITVTPGGSTANVLAGMVSLGGTAVLMSRVGNDEKGDAYRSQSEKIGMKTRLGRDSAMTGHAITFITPDSERTFATHLGAALAFGKADIIPDDIAKSKILHIEGYLLEHPDQLAGCLSAIQTAAAHDCLVSIDFADPSLIGRNRERFIDLARHHADIIFCNEDEARALTGADGEQALAKLHELCGIAVVKLGERGSMIRMGEETVIIPIYKTSLVNTNGAGDTYAAGFLYGLVKGHTIERAGHIGSYASSLVVSQIGARLERRVDVLAELK